MVAAWQLYIYMHITSYRYYIDLWQLRRRSFFYILVGYAVFCEGELYISFSQQINKADDTR